jgi:RNA recognition motif-containing protein
MIKTLYVGNLPWSATEEELTELFGTKAEVISARIVTDRQTGRSRGFGFVEVPEESVAEVIEGLNGYEMDGRQITVNEARERRGNRSRAGRSW